MGFLEMLFGPGGSTVEKQLEELTVPMFQTRGESLFQARASFAKLLQQVKEEARKEGTENLPMNYGDLLLEKESSDQGIKVALAKLRDEGVTNDDIRSWWNQPDLARRMSLKMAELTRGASYMLARREGKSPDEAARETFRFHARYGDPDDTSLASGEDRPLPIELRDRINAYGEQWRPIPDKYTEELNQSSSYNAWIRQKLKLGTIVVDRTPTKSGKSMLDATITDISEAVVKEYGTYTFTTEEARKALEAIQDKIKVWFDLPQILLTDAASQCIHTFVNAELDHITPGKGGLGRRGEKIPRLAARHRVVVSRMRESAFHRLRQLVQRHILCGYLFGQYRYDLKRENEPKLSEERLYRMWITTIYSSLVVQLDPRNKDEEELRTLWFGATGRGLRDHLQKEGIGWQELDTIILTAYFDGGSLLRLLEAAPLSDDELIKISTGGAYPG